MISQFKSDSRSVTNQIEKIIEFYQSCFDDLNSKLKYFSNLPHNKVLTESVFKIHHNPWLGEIKKKRAAEILHSTGYQTFLEARGFFDIYNLVESTTKPIGGFGDMTNYDISLNIGAAFKKYPEAVFLQCGSKLAAEAVLGSAISQRYLPIATFRKRKFPNLKAHELQMLLCVARKELVGIFKLYQVPGADAKLYDKKRDLNESPERAFLFLG